MDTYSGYAYIDDDNWDTNHQDYLIVISVMPESNFMLNTGVSGLVVITSAGSADGSMDPTQITIGSQGGIYASNVGIALVQGGDIIENDGVIHADYQAVTGGGHDHGVYSSLVNNGTIVAGMMADSSAIFTFTNTADTTETLNTGKIEAKRAGSDAIHHDGNSVDHIVNIGTIVGAIDMGDGADSYDGRKGTLLGSVAGGGGDDTIRTGDDDDRLDGGAGADTLNGGAGDDTYVLGADKTDTIKDASGNDTITSTISRNLVNYKGIENITLVAFSVANAIGNGGANTLVGSLSSNTLDGRAGDDVLSGGNGGDTLLGGSGKDALTGGSGRDVMTGGADSDRFVFFQGDGGVKTTTVDTITDWSTADSIDTSIKGTAKNYYEHSVNGSVDTIEEAVRYTEAHVTDKAIAHVFLYNSAKDIGFLLMDLNNNDDFETSVILSHSGKASDFSQADLI